MNPYSFYCVCHAQYKICSFFFFFNDTATTEIYTLSLHDALPIYPKLMKSFSGPIPLRANQRFRRMHWPYSLRSEEHTSELQSQSNLVCRLLLEKKKIHIHDAIDHSTTNVLPADSAYN